MLFFLLTNIIEENSIVLCSGAKAEEILKQSNHIEEIPSDGLLVPGMVSRKKQFLPIHPRNLAAVMHNWTNFIKRSGSRIPCCPFCNLNGDRVREWNQKGFPFGFFGWKGRQTVSAPEPRTGTVLL